MGVLRERLRYTWFAHFAKPASERCLHRDVRRGRVRRLLEIGIGDASRARRLILTAAIEHTAAAVHYAAIDLFEAGPVSTSAHAEGQSSIDSSARPLSIKEAHRLLRPTGARVRLLPGDPYMVLARSANDLGRLDMIIVAPDAAAEALERAWFFVPRLLHDQTRFWVGRRQDNGTVRYEVMPLEDIRALGRAAQAQRRAPAASAVPAREASPIRRAA